MTVFKTKSGVTLEYNDGKFTSSDMRAIKEALLEDYNSEDILASALAQNLLSMIQAWLLGKTSVTLKIKTTFMWFGG